MVFCLAIDVHVWKGLVCTCMECERREYVKHMADDCSCSFVVDQIAIVLFFNVTFDTHILFLNILSGYCGL